MIRGVSLGNRDQEKGAHIFLGVKKKFTFNIKLHIHHNTSQKEK
jgi:hypothetical protein